MTMPKTYDPQQGYKWQIFIRYIPYDREWEHLDYAESMKEKDTLIQEYRLGNGYDPQYQFKAVRLPRKYWKKPVKEAA